MRLPFTALPLLLALLEGAIAAAQPQQPAPWGPGVRHIDLTEGAASQVHAVGISPGLTTALRFHGGIIHREGVVLEGRERFWMAVVEDAILLVPSEQLVSGEPPRLTVPFKDGALPASVTFRLVVHPAQAERQVEVYRQPRTAGSLRAEAKEKDAQLQQCRERVEHLQAELKQPPGLTGLLATGTMGKTGIIPKDIYQELIQRPGNALDGRSARSFRSAQRVAVELWLNIPEGTAPWTAQGAALLGKAGEGLNGLTVWQQVPAPGEIHLRVVVEADAAQEEARGAFTLKLWDADGKRTITLGNVTFP